VVVGCDAVLGMGMVQVMEAGRSESIKDAVWFFIVGGERAHLEPMGGELQVQL
jgi:hypothetical protein